MKLGLTEEQKKWLFEAKERDRARRFTRTFTMRPLTEEERCEHDWRYCGLMARQCRKCGRLEA